MLDDATKLLYEITENISNSIDRIIEGWAKRKGWRGTYAWYEDDWTAFWPSAWQIGDEESKDLLAWYSWENKDDDGSYWTLTDLTSERTGITGFRFAVDVKQFTCPTKREWRKFCDEQRTALPELESSGFKYDESSGTWFLPWRLDAKQLAEAYASGSIEDALDPVRDALRKIDEAHPHFEKLIEADRKST